jgi:predicted TPR repeat methyltransferase
VNAPTVADPSLLIRRVRQMVALGRTHAARPLVAALRAASEPSVELSELEARLLLREGRPADAIAELDRALAAAPDAFGLRICRADARMQANDAVGAAADAAEAVVLDRTSAEAKAMLGIALIETDHIDDALICLREAVAAQPGHPAFRQGLARALERSGDADAAAATLAEGIALAPQARGLRIAAIMVAMRRRDFTAAAALAEAARRDGVADACVFGLHGHALSCLGRHQDANAAYMEALKLAPEDPYVRHLVAAAGALPGSDRAPIEYLETVFDGYAGHFECHLVSLGYRVPGLIRATLLEHLARAGNGPRLGPVLDLGCGTGLLAVTLADLGLGPFVGVDLSSAMLAEARAKGLYGSLHQGDIVRFLETDDRTWPLMLAGDVFCYFGALDTVLTCARTRLQPGGRIVFTVEDLTGEAPPPWALGPQGRYAHRGDYVADAVGKAGLQFCAVRREVLRDEGAAPVPGLLVVAEHADVTH